MPGHLLLFVMGLLGSHYLLSAFFPGLPQVVSTPAWCGGCFVSESRRDKQVIPA